MYTAPDPVADEATPILVPLAVALAVAGVCLALTLFAVPWDSIPAPIVCTDEPVRSGLLGRHVSFRQVCGTDTSMRTAVSVACGLVSTAIVVFAVVAVVRGLSTRRRA